MMVIAKMAFVISVVTRMKMTVMTFIPKII